MENDVNKLLAAETLLHHVLLVPWEMIWSVDPKRHYHKIAPPCHGLSQGDRAQGESRLTLVA